MFFIFMKKTKSKKVVKKKALPKNKAKKTRKPASITKTRREYLLKKLSEI